MALRVKFCLATATLGVALGTANAASFDLGSVLGAGKDLATAAKGIDEKDEIEIGREAAGRLLGAAPLVNDPTLQAYVNRVGRWVASQAERPNLPWRFGIIDTSDVNAFAAPGGYILITRGLYEILDNEAQLAGVLGHEIGHVVKRHHVTVMQKSAAISGIANLAQSRNRSVLVDKLIGTGAEIFARGLDQEAEFEADQIGIVLAARAGYNPFGLIEVLHKLAARSAGDASLALLFETHPTPGDRLSQLGAALEPRVATLPAGKEPGIQQVSADVPPPAAAAKPAAAPAGTRALQQEETAAPAARSGSKGGIGVDPGSILKGIFGR